MSKTKIIDHLASNIFFILSIFVLLNCCGCAKINKIEFRNSPTKLPLIFERQLSSTSCGVACLVSVANYWGIFLVQKEIMLRFPAKSERGYSIGELKEIAHEIGFRSYAFEANIDFLEKQVHKQRPLIVPVKMPRTRIEANNIPLLNKFSIINEIFYTNHFVVIVGMSDDYVMIMDPGEGFVKIEKNSFVKYWKGNRNTVLLMAKQEESPRN